MGKINGCLKCLFFFFNAVFLVFGVMMIFGAVKSGASGQMSGSGPVIGWIFAIGVIAISTLGIYAGRTEKELLLKIFAGLVVVGMIIMLIFGIIAAVSKNKMKSSFSPSSQNSLLSDAIQQAFQCCGLSGASDWGSKIPESCACTSGAGCTSKPWGATGPNQVFNQGCDSFLKLFDYIFDIAMGLYFGFAVIALLVLVITLLMIRQIKRHDSSGGGF